MCFKNFIRVKVSFISVTYRIDLEKQFAFSKLNYELEILAFIGTHYDASRIPNETIWLKFKV